jgi:hypothetical protein
MIIEFIMELDNGNKAKFIQWINENYSHTS